MRWLYEKKTFPSEKNGTIRCTRFFGTYTITVDGYYETGSYMDSLWKRSLKKLPRDAKIKNILVLGYGGGGINKVLHDHFKNIHVTAVEWDTVMLQVAEQVIGMGKYPRPQVIVGDAREVLPSLHEHYDLILFDLFKGKNIHPDFLDQQFLNHLMRVLDHDGYVIINAFSQPEILANLSRIASQHRTWTYKYNTLALFRHFGLGHAGDPLPDGYVYRNMHSEYLTRQYHDSPFELVQNTAVGFRRHLGPITFEVYKDDRVPTIEPYPRWRLISWLPLSCENKPAAWHRDWTNAGTRQTGVIILTDHRYVQRWHENAQRQLKKWHKQSEFRIVPGTVEEMTTGFTHHDNTSYSRFIGKDYCILLKKNIATHGERVHLWVSKSRLTGEVIAGLAVVDIPETGTSLHLLAFTLQGHNNGAGTALIDRWHQESLANNIRFLDVDLVWAPGDPRGWQGYSRFKKQFNVYLIKRPPAWIRLVPPSRK